MWARVITIIALLILPTIAVAQAEERIAPLIGNRDYKPGVGSLTNALNDIRNVSDARRPRGRPLSVLPPSWRSCGSSAGANGCVAATPYRGADGFAVRQGCAAPVRKGSTPAAASRRTTCPAASAVPRIVDQVDVRGWGSAWCHQRTGATQQMASIEQSVHPLTAN